MGRVALIGENSIELIHILIDIWNSGDCAVLIDWRIPFQTAVEMMKEACVYKCYIEKKQFDKVDNHFSSGIDVITFIKEGSSAEYLPDVIYKKFRENYAQNEALVLFSSGTTGKAKGIILTHYAINTNADAIIQYAMLEKGDCFYIAKSLAHSSTIVGELLVCLKTGTKAVIAETVMHPRFILKKICELKVSILCVNPILLSLLTNEFSSKKYHVKLKKIYTSGSILDKNVLKKAEQVFQNIPILNVYGLSEAGPRVSAQTLSCKTENSVGKPIRGVEVQIRSPNEDILGANIIGLVFVKTCSMFTGYVNQTPCFIEQEGWFNTHDLGYIDEQGELFIVGRADDLIISGAHKIYPSDIETIVLSYEHIRECVVFGVPNERYGEIIVCIYQPERPINRLDLVRFCEKYLSSYEIPSKWVTVSEALPKYNGKISRKKIREDYLKRKENLDGYKK